MVRLGFLADQLFDEYKVAISCQFRAMQNEQNDVCIAASQSGFDSGSSPTIPFLDVAAQTRSVHSEVSIALERVMQRSDFVLGSEAETFDLALAHFLRVEHVVSVGSGLDAIRLSLAALEIGPGDEVIVPANTFIATALAVSAVGAKVVLVDCDPHTYNIDLEQIESAVTLRTRAVIAVHLTGQPADMQPILELARRRGLHVLEDVAQAAGASYRGTACGTLGTAGCFSFYPSKNLGAFGDGGAIATNDAELAARIRRLRNYGQETRYDHREKGINSRLDTLQAAVLNVKLPRLQLWNAARLEHAVLYRELLAGVGDIEFQYCIPDTVHVYHLFVIETQERDALQRFLASSGIETRMHYPTPIHLQRAYAELGLGRGAFPNAERLAATSLSLPMFPELRQDQIKFVADAVRAWFERR